MARTLDTSDSRGTAKHGWLYSRHSFSFANYHNPERMGFGLLRVINDDIVQASMGFDAHSHKDMEIISIPLSGSLRHEDSMGNKHVISAGELQVMSAGTGITHSEYNNSDSIEVNFLQIWVIPKELGIQPRYDQKEIDDASSNNTIQIVVAPMGTKGVVNINQDSYFSIATIDANTTINYEKHERHHGIYFFLVDGKINIEGNQLSERDGLGITEEDNIEIIAQNNSRLLCIEVPMT